MFLSELVSRVELLKGGRLLCIVKKSDASLLCMDRAKKSLPHVNMDLPKVKLKILAFV
jgi:hypothetical protein